MEIGMICLGRMGLRLSQRLIRGGHRVVGYDPNPAARRAVAEAAEAGAGGSAKAVASLDKLAALLKTPRVIWLMVPAGEVTDQTLEALRPQLARGDTLIDGGNSNYQESIRRAAAFDTAGIGYVDCGTSGGVWGAENGFSLMLGGEEKTIAALAPIFSTLAPAKDKGWGRVGPSGAGHFVKMIHNGVEYGLMQAYAEGFAILAAKTAFGLDLQAVADIWRHGSVVRSWLLDLTADALAKNPTLAGVAPFVADSGEGRWTVAEAIALDVPAPVITEALIARLRSRADNSFADRLLAVMRAEFGGHAVKHE
jgi:6-phosphogluconate dehydrogenase